MTKPTGKDVLEPKPIDFGEYTAKNVKGFKGTDGDGYSADLCRGTKKVASIVDNADGSMVNIWWKDTEGERVKISVPRLDGSLHTYKGTPDEKIFRDHMNNLPPYPYDKWTKEMTGKDYGTVDEGIFLGALIDKHDNDKRCKRLCRTKTLFTVKGEDDTFYTYNAPYNQKTKERITSICSDRNQQLDEIINERFLNEEA